MDELLKQKPRPLVNERKEMFALLDRFTSSIGSYLNQYASIVKAANADIQQKTAEAQAVQKKMADTHKLQQDTARKNRDGKVASLNKQISDCQNRATADIQSQEKQVTDLEKNEKIKLNKAHDDAELELSVHRESAAYLHDLINQVDTHMGTTWTGESKLEKIRQNLNIQTTINSEKKALEALDTNVQNVALDLRTELVRMPYGMIDKVAYALSKTDNIENLLRLSAAADKAITFLEKHRAGEQKQQKAVSDKKCSDKRAECNKKKQVIAKKRDDTVKELKNEIVKVQEQFQSQSAQMAANYQTNRSQQEKHYAQQIANAKTRWQQEIKKCHEKFVTDMEIQYPSKNMNAWLNQFWYHPKSVEDYNKINSLQLNALIGLATVNISGWYKGETGKYIREVLTKYICLFGRNREQAIKSYHEGKILLPYSLSIEEGDSLLLSFEEGADTRAKAMLNAIGMRLLRSVPACMMRFQLFDANGIGAFGRLMSLDPAIGNNPSEPIVKSFAIGDGGKVHSSHRDIAEQISETKITMDDLSRQLTNYNSIREFNEKNPLSKQIYRPILMMNFPMGLEEKEVRMLNAMKMDCSKWGFSMIMAQPDKAVDSLKPEFKTAIEELRKNVICIRMGATGALHVINSISVVERNAQISLYGLPDQTQTAAIAVEIRKQSVEASRVLIEFSDAKEICPERNRWFTQRADDGIVIPVGYLDGGQPFKLQFDDKHVHTIVMGNTGSGKTNLLHVLMTNMMLRYAPEEVMIYLIDFKYGLDFRMYTQYNLPNFKTISINNDPEFALAMLQNLEKEQEERSMLMGSRYKKISEYNAANPNNRMNRIVLIVDELYELAKKASDDVQKSILKKIDSFAHQTRAFGIHMIVCGQDLDKIENFETIKNQCTTRLALHCGDEQVKMLMDEAGVVRMHTIDATDQGACVFSLSGGSNPQIEHTTYLDSGKQDMFLSEIHKHYLDKQQMTNVKVLLTKVSDNPNHPLQMFVNNGYIPNLMNNRLLVGEPIAMERELRLFPTGNLWLTGGNVNDEAMMAGQSVMFFGALSLLTAKLKQNNLEMICTNCNDQPMRSVEEEETDLIGQMTSNYQAFFKYSTGENLKNVLRFLLQELDERRGGTKSAKKAIWWFLVRPEVEQTVMDDSNVIIDLKELLQIGPKYNIHVVLWNADIKLAQKMQLDRTLFKERICLEMNSEDSKQVNGSELKPAPSGFKAILVGNNTMRFRVYDLPDGKWMNMLFERLNGILNKK